MGSLRQCSGYNDFKDVMGRANLNIKSTDISVIYLSTMRAKESTGDDHLFLEHLGHSKDINKTVYQAPPARRTIKEVGKFLKEIHSLPNGEDHSNRPNNDDDETPAGNNDDAPPGNDEDTDNENSENTSQILARIVSFLMLNYTQMI